MSAIIAPHAQRLSLAAATFVGLAASDSEMQRPILQGPISFLSLLPSPLLQHATADFRFWTLEPASRRYEVKEVTMEGMNAVDS